MIATTARAEDQEDQEAIISKAISVRRTFSISLLKHLVAMDLVDTVTINVVLPNRNLHQKQRVERPRMGMSNLKLPSKSCTKAKW